MKILSILVVALFITHTKSYCNNDLYNYDGKPLLMHINSVPLYYNPGFAGTTGKARLTMNYLNKRHALKNDSSNYSYSEPINYHFSYDQLIDRIHAGIGIIAYKTTNMDMQDYLYFQSLDSIIISSYWDSTNQQTVYQYQYQYVNHYLYKPSNSFYTGAVYSQKISLDQKITISPSVKIGYVNTRLKPGTAYYQYLIDKSLLNNKTSYLDISTGILVNTGKLYAGFTIDHVNKPKVPGFISTVAALQKLPVYIYQAGYTYQKAIDSKFTLSCNLLYARQQKTKNTSSIVNISCKYKWASIGLSSGTGKSDALSGMIGFHTKNFVIGYSKNILTGYSSRYGWLAPDGTNGTSSTTYDYNRINSHEVSIKYLFNIKNKKKEANKTGS